uniref:tyrosine-protein phosphatase non-receptor type substrate 1-like isoform X2 n=1 Tax=Pristiophorus japonicus TaxID=55135 RepID=UPI00398E522D
MPVLSMFGRAQLYSILILAVICTAAAGDATVNQWLDKNDIITGQTATFHCSFPLFRDKNKIAVHWWKEGTREFLRQDPRRNFKVESKASATLRLLDVRFGDAGVYYCRVEGQYVGNSTGVKLNVRASPEPLKIFPTLFANGSLMCLCKTSGFYPADHTIAWRKDGQEVATGVTKFVELNTEGLYEAFSYLEEIPPIQIGTVYICEVSHPTLTGPTWVNYTVGIADNGVSDPLPWWIYLCGAIALLLLIIAAILCCKFCKCKRKDLLTSSYNLQAFETQAWHRLITTS